VKNQRIKDQTGTKCSTRGTTSSGREKEKVKKHGVFAWSDDDFNHSLSKTSLTGWYSQIRRAKRDDQLIRAYAALQQAVEFCARVRVLPLNDDALERFHELRISKRRLGTNDLRIAAIVLVQGAILVTRNMSDFKGIPGLALEDWR
jgi:predicted nucleic acid-binding protein